MGVTVDDDPQGSSLSLLNDARRGNIVRDIRARTKQVSKQGIEQDKAKESRFSRSQIKEHS